jgi:hypothetical protein
MLNTITAPLSPVTSKCTTRGRIRGMKAREELLNMFGLPITPIGLTDFGQIISRQKFIVGELPSQSEVNAFISSAGMLPVKAECLGRLGRNFATPPPTQQPKASNGGISPHPLSVSVRPRPSTAVCSGK